MGIAPSNTNDAPKTIGRPEPVTSQTNPNPPRLNDIIVVMATHQRGRQVELPLSLARGRRGRFPCGGVLFGVAIHRFPWAVGILFG